MALLGKSWRIYWEAIVESKKSLVIDVTDRAGNKIGELCPINKSSINIDTVVSSLTEWRRKYSKFFFTEFEASDTRTKSWILNSVLANVTQMLFLIYCDGQLIGQYGFKNLNDSSVFMDNLIRGVSGGHPKLMERSMRALISWLFENHDIDDVRGSVLSDNPFAMMVNKTVGFEYVCETKNILEDGRFSRDIILTRTRWEAIE